MRLASALTAAVCLLLLSGCSTPVALTFKSYSFTDGVQLGQSTTQCGGNPKQDMHVIEVEVANERDTALDLAKHGWLVSWPNGMSHPPVQRTYGLVSPEDKATVRLYDCAPPGVARATAVLLLNSTSVESEVLARLDIPGE